MLSIAPPPAYYQDGNPKSVARGWLHEYAALAFLVYGVVLVLLAAAQPERTQDRVAAALVFVMGTLLCFSISAAYHRIEWGSAERENTVRRWDHACISVLLFADAFPMALLVYSHVAMLIFLGVSGAVALAAMVYSWRKELEAKQTNALACGMYIVLATLQFSFAHQVYWWAGPHWVFALWITSYAVDALGAAAYKFGLGDTEYYCCCHPSVFSSHDIFHACTVAAQAMLAIVHFYVIVVR